MVKLKLLHELLCTLRCWVGLLKFDFVPTNELGVLVKNNFPFLRPFSYFKSRVVYFILQFAASDLSHVCLKSSY